LQQFEISFDKKMKKNKTMENSDFWKFETPLVAMETGNLGLSMLLQRLWSSQHLCQVSSVLKHFSEFDSCLNL
jgi:hypothetical protein